MGLHLQKLYCNMCCPFGRRGYHDDCYDDDIPGRPVDPANVTRHMWIRVDGHGLRDHHFWNEMLKNILNVYMSIMILIIALYVN